MLVQQPLENFAGKITVQYKTRFQYSASLANKCIDKNGNIETNWVIADLPDLPYFPIERIFDESQTRHWQTFWNFLFILLKAYSELCYSFKMELFTKIVNGCQPLFSFHFLRSAVASICNPAALKAAIWKDVGLIPIGGNTVSIGELSVKPSAPRQKERKYWNWNDTCNDLRFQVWLTAWKVSKYGVFSGPYFPAFWLNTERLKRDFNTDVFQWNLQNF